jgi:hemoglobin/transferrin/lactoferrin receptor protein
MPQLCPPPTGGTFRILSTLRASGSLLALLGWLAAPSGVHALPLTEENRMLSGIVEDTSGGAIPGATVTVTCGTEVRTVQTGAAGAFELRGLPAAVCAVSAVSDLFSPAEVAVDLGQRSATYVRLILPIAGLQSEVTVTAARGEAERVFDVPETVAVTTRAELDARPIQILPQALREEAGILVQQTTTAQGSPFIRGFSAQRIVYLVDGIRLNTSTFRAGATQYLGWINPGLVQRMEIVRGPASVQYGSDALGGTINVLSLQPAPLGAGKARVSGSVEAMLGSADLSAGGEAAMLVEAPRLALRAGAASRRVDELRPGRGRDSHSALTRFLGLPSDVLYTRLPGTGFSQAGGHLAATVALNEASTLSGLYLHEEQFGVERYDRLLGGDGLFRSDFEPQRLDFGYLRYRRGRTGFLNEMTAAISLNRQQDDRAEQALPGAAIEREAGRVTAYGYQAQGSWIAANRLAMTAGAEVYDEYIGASRILDDPGAGGAEALRPEIPDGTRYTSAGAFVQGTGDLLPGRLTLRGGLRYATFLFRTRPDAPLAVEDERVSTRALTFHTGGLVRVSPALNGTFTISRGFRAANAFDLGAIGISGGGFELSPSQAAALGAEVGSNDGATAVGTGQPVRGLAPESVYAFEGGFKLRTTRLGAALTLFDLELVDIIQRRTAIFGPGVVGRTVAGHEIVAQDTAGRAYVAADPRPILTRVNVDRARIRGIEGDVQWRLRPQWIAGAYGSAVFGRELGAGAPLRRMPPPLGGARLKWEPPAGSLWLEGVATLAGRQARLSPGDLGDPRIGARRTRATIAQFFDGQATNLGLVQNGILLATGETLAEVQARVLGDQAAAALFTSTPGFVVFGARAGWRAGARVDFTVIADNPTDRNYRWHGSGVDAPGFNVQFKTRYRF